MEIPKLKTAKVKGRAVGFMTFLVVYGKLIKDGVYKLELVLPLTKLLGYVYITIYKGKTKPKLHNLYLIGTVYFPFYCIAAVLILIVYLIIAIIQLICGFFYNYLLDDDDVLLRISGFISLALSVIGIITVIKWFI